MRRSIKILSFMVSLIVTFLAEGSWAGDEPATAPNERSERTRFVGVWKGFAVAGKGETPDRGPVQLELTITERTIRGIQIHPEERIDHGEGEYVLTLVAEPWHLDAAKTSGRGRQQAYVGIYRIEGETLKWCVSPQKVRPQTFETKKGQFLLFLKRDATVERSSDLR